MKTLIAKKGLKVIVGGFAATIDTVFENRILNKYNE